jgi:hypothetical protein
MDSFENNNDIIDAIQARENDLKNQQIQLGKEINAGQVDADKIHSIVEVHEYRVEMKAAMNQ